MATVIRRAWLVVALGLACEATAGPNGHVAAVETIDVEAVSMLAARIRWAPVGGADVISYRLERRANFTGGFIVVAANIPQTTATEVVYFDIGLEPETYYGYRVVAQSRFGAHAVPSLVRAALTPPRPSVLVTTFSILDTPAAGDPDGYFVVLRSSTDSASMPVGLGGAARFGPLTPGLYSVELRNIAGHCAIDGSWLRSAAVTDQGVHTVDTVHYQVSCRDPGLGRITAVVNIAGDSLAATGPRIHLIGRPTSGPDSIVARSFRADSAGGQRTFDLLYPGPYEISIDSIPAHCTLDGSIARNVTVAPLSSDTVRYAIACQGGGSGSGPYAWTNTWSASTAPNGQRVALDVTLDVSSNAAERVGAVEAQLRFDPAVLRYDSASARSLGIPTVNSGTSGLLIWNTFTLGAAPGGVVPLVRFHFTAIGTNGAIAGTRTTVDLVADGSFAELADSLFRIVEDTVAVGTGGGNQAPNAEANGPYSGSASTPIGFSATGSSDPDGTIASYSWAFGDGGTGTSAAPMHAYSAPGTYTATLTVTDNQGATDTDQASVTVNGSGPTQPFTWSGTFGAINPMDSVVALTLTFDLTTDIVETPGAEQLERFFVDSLKWNSAVLRFHAFNWGPGGSGAMQESPGKLIFSSFTMPSINNSGLITIATIRFKAIGAPATSATTATFLGPLTGTAATGSYAYRPRTSVQEATLVVP